MPRSLDDWRRSEATALPGWIKPQLTRLVDQAPEGPDWLHEIKFDGYRMHARLDRGAVRLLPRTGLDWTHKYPAIAAAVTSLPARQAYLDGELCGVRPDGTTSFSMIQLASDSNLLHLDGRDFRARPLVAHDRDRLIERLQAIEAEPTQGLAHRRDRQAELPRDGWRGEALSARSPSIAASLSGALLRSRWGRELPSR